MGREDSRELVMIAGRGGLGSPVGTRGGRDCGYLQLGSRQVGVATIESSGQLSSAIRGQGGRARANGSACAGPIWVALLQR